MKNLSEGLYLIAEAYLEFTKQAKVKDTIEQGIEKFLETFRKIPLIVFVLFSPVLFAIAGFGILIYTTCLYFLTFKNMDEILSLGITGVVMIFISALINFIFQKKLEKLKPSDVAPESVVPKEGPVKDIFMQFSKEQNQLIEDISSKLMK